MLGFRLVTHSCEVNGEMPGSRESNGKLADLWCLFVCLFLPSDQVLMLSLR